MFTIRLNDLQFFSYHGVHDAERILGNAFEVNVSIDLESSEKGGDRSRSHARLHDAYNGQVSPRSKPPGGSQ